MWTEVIRYAEVTSTNDVARDHARRGAAEGTAVVAANQVAGRGRHGRDWQAPADEALLVSYILRPPSHLTHSAWIGLAAGVAAARAAGVVSGLSVGLKWPNDILFDGRKLGGVLVESLGTDAGYAHIVGVGLNVAQTAESMPPDLRETATSLCWATGRSFAPAELLPVLTGELHGIYSKLLRDGPEPVRAAWRELDQTLGRSVQVEAEDGLAGRAVEIDPNGALVVELADGSHGRVVAGDVVVWPGG